MGDSEDGWRRLQAELGGPPPESLAKLDEASLRDLASSVHDARRRQAAELAAAGERSLRHIPRLLRGPVRKVVGG